MEGKGRREGNDITRSVMSELGRSEMKKSRICKQVWTKPYITYQLNVQIS